MDVKRRDEKGRKGKRKGRKGKGREDNGKIREDKGREREKKGIAYVGIDCCLLVLVCVLCVSGNLIA